jgi:hypothetical protein
MVDSAPGSRTGTVPDQTAPRLATLRLLAALACLLLGGCSLVLPGGLATVPTSRPPSAVPASPTAVTSHGPSGEFAPPPFLVRYDGTELQLYASTYCTQDAGRGVCADGFDHAPPSIGSVEELFVFVPMADFDSLDVSLSVPDGSGEAIFVLATALGGNWWQLRPHAPVGSYRMSIFASGDGSGDMVADVMWESAG